MTVTAQSIKGVLIRPALIFLKTDAIIVPLYSTARAKSAETLSASSIQTANLGSDAKWESA